MFGIQWSQANHDQFLVSLYAGLIANIVTAIMGGLVVWFIISMIDRRRLRRQYEREVSEFREKLRFALDKLDAFYLTNIATPPVLASTLANQLQEYPISIWRENLKKEKELFAAITAFQRAYSEFMAIAGNIQTLVQNGIRYFNEKQLARFVIILDVSFCEKYLLGKLLDMGEKEILVWMGAYEDNLPLLEKVYKESFSKEFWQEKAVIYQHFRKNLELSVGEVKKLL